MMKTFEEINQLLTDLISDVEFEMQPASLFAPITYTLSLGGKRIRPALTLMACNLFTEDVTQAVNPAIGIEIFHNFTLLHDDLMDGANLRRNNPTVHKKWSPNAAILSGDAMLVASYQYLTRTEPIYLKAVLDLFSNTAMQVCAGQQYDMEFETRMDVSEDEYLEMIRLKTAVLLACSLKVGALIGGASSSDAECLYNYGIYLGLAFQLQDDLLDVYGDSQTFGKSIGGDILCNKKTFLLINALAKSSKEQRAVLDHWLSQSDVSNPSEKIQAVTDVYNELNLRKLSEEIISDYSAKAVSCLTSLSVSSDRLTVLSSVVNKMLHRQS